MCTPKSDLPVIAGRTSPTVTIILTNYNHAQYLDTSLSGIVGQTRPADEIIVIDDGSTDNSLEIIESFAAKTPSIRVLVNEQNRGVQYTIARALGAVTSDWLVWAAADDKLLPNFLQRGMEMIERYPDTGVVFSQLATFHDVTGEERHYAETSDHKSAFYIGSKPTRYTPAQLLDRLSDSYLWLSGNTAIVRRDALFDIGGFIPKLEWHSDWYAFYAVALRHGAVAIPNTLAMMRVVPETYSSTGMKDKKKQAQVMNAIVDVLNRPDFSDLRRKFRARPCLFSPFRREMLASLARRPRDWDLFIRMVYWALDYKRTQYSRLILGGSSKSKLATRVKRRVSHIGCRLFDVLTPRSWTTDETLEKI